MNDRAGGMLLVFTNPAPGHDEEFNRWYDTVHIPEVLALPAFRTAQRFRRSATQMPGMTGGDQAYLISWQVENMTDAISQLGEAIGSGVMTVPEFVTDLHAMSFDALDTGEAGPLSS